MGVQQFLDYEEFIKLQDRQLEIWGQNCTIFVPENLVNLGYENVTKDNTDKMNVDSVLSNKYNSHNARIWINFTVTKNVFYKFNWFPDDADELCMAVMNSDAPIHENCYIRTSTSQSTSIWGDMIFQIVKIQDVGLAKVLQRFYFLKPTANAELNELLSVR